MFTWRSDLGTMKARGNLLLCTSCPAPMEFLSRHSLTTYIANQTSSSLLSLKPLDLSLVVPPRKPINLDSLIGIWMNAQKWIDNYGKVIPGRSESELERLIGTEKQTHSAVQYPISSALQVKDRQVFRSPKYNHNGKSVEMENLVHTCACEWLWIPAIIHWSVSPE